VLKINKEEKLSLTWNFSYISGISLLGIPTEVYVYGIQYAYIIGGFLVMTVVMSRVYLPVFHGLNLTSTYEVFLASTVKFASMKL